MKVTRTGGDFKPHPEYQGQAVIVDVTDLKEMDTKYGKKKVFRVVMESLEKNDDGKHWCVWSAPFAPSLHEKAGFRKFLKGVLGRDLTPAEVDGGFETEDLIGMNVFVVITQVEEGDKVFANIASATPWDTRKGPAIKPSGDYKRVKDRDTKAVEQPPAKEDAGPADLSQTVIHMGKHRGHELRDVDEGSIMKLIELWLPGAKKLEKPSADDRRLIKALDWFVEQKAAKAAAPAAETMPEDCPY